MNIEYTVDTDVLVIGSGGAGIKAAIKAAEGGTEVLLVSKFGFGHTGSTFYPGTRGWGMNAVLFPGDSPELFLEEIMDAAAGTADRKLASILAGQCTSRFHELEEYGLRFNQDAEGNYLGVIPCFGKRLRGSATYGIDIIRKTMWKVLMKHQVAVRSSVTVITLVKQNGVCAGAVALDEMGELMLIKAKAVILSTGGACGIYRHGLATPDQTGDGYIMALEAGARAVNLEFIQFIPGLTWPVKKMLFQEKNLDTLPSVTNGKGEDILEKYLPPGVSREECLVERAKHGPFSTVGEGRYMDIAMYEEWRKGNAAESGGIHLQYDPKILKDDRWFITSWLEWMNSKNIDVVNRGFDMIPHAQGFNGGIYIDENCSAGVPGLFAAGETAGGPHGADRLGGAAMAATQVFGAIAGTAAAEWAGKNSTGGITEKEAEEQVIERFDKSGGGIVNIPESLEKIRTIMWETAAIVRSEERCASGLKAIEDIKTSFNPLKHYREGVETKKTAELVSHITLAELLLRIIRFRKESRGPHYRVDYPEMDGGYEGMVAVEKREDGYSLELIRQGE